MHTALKNWYALPADRRRPEALPALLKAFREARGCVFPGPLAIADERFRGRLIALGSASKTFNLAGLRTAVAHIDHELLNAAIGEMPGHLLGSPSSLGVVGTVAAWTACDDWLDAARRWGAYTFLFGSSSSVYGIWAVDANDV